MIFTVSDEVLNDVRRNLYGRRGSRLRGGKRATFDSRRDRHAALPDGTAPGSLERAALFGDRAQALWLEVGFGAGEHLVAQAQANPGVGLIGCEHYLDAVASCLSKIEADSVTNVRVHHGDARDLMDALPKGSVDRAFLLYPDPWPKARHHKRRFISDENLDSFARVLAAGAHLRVASDIPDYIDWTREHLVRRSDFAVVSDTGEAWADWPGTRYEAKALREGRVPHYLTYERVIR